MESYIEIATNKPGEKPKTTVRSLAEVAVGIVVGVAVMLGGLWDVGAFGRAPAEAKVWFAVGIAVLTFVYFVQHRSRDKKKGGFRLRFW